MRQVPFNPETDINNWTLEQRSWWTEWVKRAEAATDAALTEYRPGGKLAFRSAIWGELKKWLLHNFFGGKCAYCEVKVTGGFFGEGEHYRPKAKVTVKRGGRRVTVEHGGTLHSGYYWLAYQWSNLLPACQECNNRKVDQFPVAAGHVFDAAPSAADLDGKEDPFLLHPCRDDPRKFLKFGKFGVITAIDDNPRALHTIDVLGLDREGLEERRREAQERAYPALASALHDLAKRKTPLKESLTEFTNAKAEFSVAVADFLTESLKELTPEMKIDS